MTLKQQGILLCVAVSLTLNMTPASAISIPVVNSGFEDISGESPFNEFTFGELVGWQLYDPESVTDNGDGPTYFIGTLTPTEADPVGNPGVYEFFPNGAAEGQRVGIAFNYAGSDGQGEYGLYQELSDTLQPHTTYLLEVEVGNIGSGTSVNETFFPLDGFPGYRIELYAGEMILNADNNSLAGTIADGQFATSTVAFSTGASHDQMGQQLGIRLINLNQVDPSFPNSDLEVDFDDVRLDSSPALGGDFDFDGNVDGNDFLVWQRSVTLNDSNLFDLAAWQTNFAADPMSVTLVVPEPTSFSLLISTLLILLSGNDWSRGYAPKDEAGYFF